jgi:hypothetical protein
MYNLFDNPLENFSHFIAGDLGLWSLNRKGSISCYTCCDTASRFLRGIQKTYFKKKNLDLLLVLSKSLDGCIALSLGSPLNILRTIYLTVMILSLCSLAMGWRRRLLIFRSKGQWSINFGRRKILSAHYVENCFLNRHPTWYTGTF